MPITSSVAVNPAIIFSCLFKVLVSIFLEKEFVAINPRFDKLITALRTAVDNEGTLDKEATSYDDIFDTYRLALEFYHHKSE